MDPSQALAIAPAYHLADVAPVADQAAASHVLADYQAGLAPGSRRRQQGDFACFVRYLLDVGVVAGDYYHTIEDWAGLSHGIVEGFVRWQLQQGYSIASVNARLTTIKLYAKLAQRAGVLTSEEYTPIAGVRGIKSKAGYNIDAERERTRVGHKKAEHVSFSSVHAALLKAQPDTPIGRRDALLMCLLLDHGLRVSEVAGLDVGNFNLQEATFRFYRPKVYLTQTHRCTPDTWQALSRYLADVDLPPESPLFLGHHRERMSTRSLNSRVGDLGRQLGIEHLSPHDGRHHWSTDAARNGTSLQSLMEAGGWRSYEMPKRYIERSSIANDGVILTSTRRNS